MYTLLALSSGGSERWAGPPITNCAEGMQKVRGYVVDGLAYQSLPPEYNGTLRPLVRRVAKRVKQSGPSRTKPYRLQPSICVWLLTALLVCYSPGGAVGRHLVGGLVLFDRYARWATAVDTHA